MAGTSTLMDLERKTPKTPQKHEIKLQFKITLWLKYKVRGLSQRVI
jgi:hypothetical protein